jgi:methyl-accepting chemotaxis protein
MDQMNKTTQQNAAASEELSATAEKMAGYGVKLQALLSFFQGARVSDPAARPAPMPMPTPTSERPIVPARGPQNAQFVPF